MSERSWEAMGPPVDPDEPVPVEHAGRQVHAALVMAAAVGPGLRRVPIWSTRLAAACRRVVCERGQRCTDRRVADAIECTIAGPGGVDAVRALVASGAGLEAWVRSRSAG